jgi:hypothetical protein
MFRYNSLPKSKDRAGSILQYNFPATKRIYWGPNQRIKEDNVYVEPEGWSFFEVLSPPKVVRFIHDSGQVDSTEGGGGGPFIVSFNCTVIYEQGPAADATNINQCIGPNSGSWAGILFPWSHSDAETLGVTVVTSYDGFVIGYIADPPSLMCDNGGFGAVVDSMDEGELIASGYFINPKSSVTYHWSNGTHTTVIYDGIDCRSSPPES